MKAQRTSADDDRSLPAHGLGPRPLRVLHVVEAFSAGVATAIEGYIDNSPTDIEHVVYGFRRPLIQTGDLVAEKARFVDLPGGKLGQIRAIWAGIEHEQPDVLHVHSSWAGTFVRALPRPLPPIVYTPHSYSFDRRDLAPTVLTGFRTVEATLARRTAVLAGCSLNELAQARTLGHAGAVMHLPYVLPDRVLNEIDTLPIPELPLPDETDVRPTSPLRVAASGRIGPQKGIDFMVEVVRQTRAINTDRPIEWIWVGGGDPIDAAHLRSAGIEVTGWCAQAEAVRWLSESHAYVHTAAWEGLPLTILEALALGLPVVAREIPALTELALERTAVDPRGVAEHVAALTEPGQYVAALSESAKIFGDRLSGEAYGRHLRCIYETAIGRRG